MKSIVASLLFFTSHPSGPDRAIFVPFSPFYAEQQNENGITDKPNQSMIFDNINKSN